MCVPVLGVLAVIRNVMFGSAVGTSTSPLPYHLNRCSKTVSFGPETWPSSDMLAPV